MSQIVTEIYGNKVGIDANGYVTAQTGAKLPALFIGTSGSEVQQPAAGAGVAAGSALTLTAATHSGKLIKLDTAAGSTVTLPTSTGQGATYRFIVSVLATSNSHIIKVANGTDVMQGLIFSRDDTSDNAVAFATAASSDTITLNRSTTGSVNTGEYIEIEDFAAGFFRVTGFIANTGTPATPFSATV